MSRKYFLMLATISLFTGMIAPAVGSGGTSLPYALTNMQYVAYTILCGITLLYILAVFRAQKLAYFVIAILVACVVSLGIMTITGMVKNFSKEVLQQFSWGWIFLLIGLFFLILTFVWNDRQEYSRDPEISELSKFYDKILGFLGILVFCSLSIFVIFIAEQNSHKHSGSGDLGTIFEPKTLLTFSGKIMSPAFEEISHFSFDRAKDKMTFLVKNSDGTTVWYPSKTSITQPENLLRVDTFGEGQFFIQKDGTVIFDKKRIGTTKMLGSESKNFLAYFGDDEVLHLVTDTGNTAIENGGEFADKFFYNTQTHDFYFRDVVAGNEQAIFKNGVQISEKYHSILEYSSSDGNNLTIIVQNPDFSKMIVKNGTTVHMMHDNYVQWSLRISSNDVIYAIKNVDDNSFSLVINGVVLDRRLDEIREIFLEKNSSGFAYFGRPQGEKQYCFFTRYRGNLCSIDKYMNPALEGDDSGIVFSAFREGHWAIYRNTTELIRDTGYTNLGDISYDYFFFDPTNFRHYVFIQKRWDKYFLIKQGKFINHPFDDIDINSIRFGYEKMFALVQDADGWHIFEF